jgi:nucleosome binding factor SPN SPT16 subunit
MESAKKAGSVLERLFYKLIDQVESIIDDEKESSHISIQEAAMNKFRNSRDQDNLAQEAQIERFVVKSGGSFSRDQPTPDQKLSYDVVHLHARLNLQGTSVECTRTLLIDPTQEIEKAYKALFDMHQVALAAMQPGTTCAQLHGKLVQCLNHRLPEAVRLLPPVLGKSIRSDKSISAEDQSPLEANDIFLLDLALHHFPKPASFKCRSSEISLVVEDTVLVNPQSYAVPLTEVGRKYNEIAYFLDNNESEQQQKKPKIDLNDLANRGVVCSSRLRNKSNNQILENERKRKDHQRELQDRKLDELRHRFLNYEGGKGDDKRGQKLLSEVSAYESVDDLPEAAKQGQIYVDTRNESVLFPIHGQVVPIHVSTIKNVSKNEEGKYIYLRINFLHPGFATIGRDSTYTLPEVKGPEAFYLRELSIRSSNSKNLNNAFRLIKELIKRVKVKDWEEEEKKNLVDQEKLIVIKGKRPMLTDLSIRPNISGKKTQGTLEAHHNGLRFTSNRNEKLDIIYRNIKHAIFQPVENELIVLLHFHLHNPIIVGNKKTSDIQFYAEAGIVSDDLDNRRRGGMDLDEIQQEVKEKQFKEKLNKEFKKFAEEVQHVSGDTVDFDIPYRELGFYGVPSKSNVFIMPSVNCLVSLIEQPFFVISLNEIEIAVFERVQFSLKNFDLVFVFKDYTKHPMRITSIPAEYFESIKDWLNDIDILYAESSNPFNWANIMKEIQKDIHAFIEDGGWSFLQESESEQEKEEVVSQSDPDSEFNEEDLGSDEDEESEFEEEDEEEYEEDEDEEESEEEESEEEGKDWDELEEEARMMDSRKRNPKQPDTRAKKKQKS